MYVVWVRVRWSTISSLDKFLLYRGPKKFLGEGTVLLVLIWFFNWLLYIDTRQAWSRAFLSCLKWRKRAQLMINYKYTELWHAVTLHTNTKYFHTTCPTMSLLRLFYQKGQALYFPLLQQTVSRCLKPVASQASCPHWLVYIPNWRIDLYYFPADCTK